MVELLKLTASEIKANLYALNLYPLGVFGGREKGVPHPNKSHNKRPILLVHGIVHNPSAFYKLKRKMDERAWQNIFTVNYSTSHGSIFKMVDQIEKRVERILAETHVDQIDIVAHSLGGLVSRLFATGVGKGKVKNLVTMGTPHLGTDLSMFLRPIHRGTLDNDLKSGSYFIKDLATRKIPKNTHLYSIYTTRDHMVWPRTNCEATGSPKNYISNIVFPTVGHMGLLYDDEVLKTVLTCLGR